MRIGASDLRWPWVLSIFGPLLLSQNALAQDVDPAALLQEMSSEIAGLDRFTIQGDAYADAGLAEGQIIEHASKVTARVLRPDSLSLTNEAADGSKEIYFHDGVFTVSTQPQNFYARADIPKGIESAVTFAMEEMNVDAPLLDLLVKDVAANLAGDAKGIRYLGTSLVRDELYHHVGIRGPEIDIQIWISVEAPRLPGKIVLTSKWEGGSPRFVAFLNWDVDPEVQRTSFEFEPADGAVRIEFITDQP